MSSAAPFRFDRTWRFERSVDELWTVLQDTGAYPRWWPWLDGFDAGPLEAGATARFRVSPPLPYSLCFTVQIDEVVERARVHTTVDGDLAGEATLEVKAVGGGSAARLVWELVLQRPSLVRAERLARPVMTWGHDIVVAMGVRQFRRRALG